MTFKETSTMVFGVFKIPEKFCQELHLKCLDLANTTDYGAITISCVVGLHYFRLEPSSVKKQLCMSVGANFNHISKVFCTVFDDQHEKLKPEYSQQLL